jgi:FeS assembly SUF system regulator
MIRMSKQTDYGILLLTEFAADPAGLTLSARELSQRAGLPLPMVSKVLKVLTREGLLLSQRGAHGGYALARRPDQITVTDVISALDGPFAMTECIDAPGDCRQESTCPVRSNWQLINQTVRRALDNITLWDMTRPLTPPLISLERGSAGRRLPETAIAQSASSYRR